MIRLAKLSEIKDILRITQACAFKMQQEGIHQWNEHYPTERPFIKDAERNELYIKEHHGKIIGAITISTKMDEEYVPVTWLTPNGNSTYIHRLCVHPDNQGKGVAQELMNFAEDYSKEHGFVSVRGWILFRKTNETKGSMNNEATKSLRIFTSQNKVSILFIVTN